MTSSRRFCNLGTVLSDFIRDAVFERIEDQEDLATLRSANPAAAHPLLGVRGMRCSELEHPHARGRLKPAVCTDHDAGMLFGEATFSR